MAAGPNIGCGTVGGGASALDCSQSADPLALRGAVEVGEDRSLLVMRAPLREGHPPR